ncbi:RNA polymerase sigma factor [Marinivivus vitaminiproducens]|uniref:RNA polymerase sigma factor n=1 Tax=Marinivivus vitaminiproducens TaxID=3035935 RepID=UPI0027A7A6C0|nr:RNA polymerase sigma factor [Geminicoccaceae bacterium SCSIO 64248]
MQDDVAQQIVALLPRLRRYALTLSRAADVADDLVQTACVRALSTRPDLDDGKRFEAWIFKVVRNLWLDLLRRRKVRGEEIDVGARDDLIVVQAEQDSERRMLLRSVATAMDDLPAEQREVVLLVCVEQVTYHEAATILDMPIGTVMSRLARARRRLAEAVEKEPAVASC